MKLSEKISENKFKLTKLGIPMSMDEEMFLSDLKPFNACLNFTYMFSYFKTTTSVKMRVNLAGKNRI